MSDDRSREMYLEASGWVLITGQWHGPHQQRRSTTEDAWRNQMLRDTLRMHHLMTSASDEDKRGIGVAMIGVLLEGLSVVVRDEKFWRDIADGFAKDPEAATALAGLKAMVRKWVLE